MKNKDLNNEIDAGLRPGAVPFWRDPGKRAIVFQVVALLLVAFVSYYLFSNTQANLERQSIATGFGFLEKEAGFEIGEDRCLLDEAEVHMISPCREMET